MEAFLNLNSRWCFFILFSFIKAQIKFGIQVPRIPTTNLGEFDIGIFKTYSNHTIPYKLGGGTKEHKDGDYSFLLAEPVLQDFGISKFDYLNEMQHSCAFVTGNSAKSEGLERAEFELTTNHAYR